MTSGVSFQPGGDYGNGQQQRGSSPTQNVQEAIKVLSLRLPKVVGARSAAPQALLSAQGSGGNPRIDSVVNQVLSRMFGAQDPGAGQMPSAPMVPTPEAGGQQAPSFSGGAQAGYQPPPRMEQQAAPQSPFGGQTPRVVVNPSHPAGDFSVGPDGRPLGNMGGAIEPLPDIWQALSDLMRRQQPGPSYEAPTQDSQPLI
jgi:hypothetical protein